MRINPSASLLLVLAASTVIAHGVAAQEVKPPTPQEQIDALEKRVRDLEAAGAPQAVQQAQDNTSSWVPKVELTGVFHLDGGYQIQDSTSEATLGELEDGLGFRRARIAAKGKFREDIRFIFEFEFAQNQADFVDVWGEFLKTPVGNVRIGRFRQPFGMSELTSIRTLPLMERPSPVVMSPFRQTGIMVSDTAMDERMTWAISGYRFPSDNFGNVYDDSGYGLATRATGLVVDEGDDGIRVHIGGSFSHNSAGRPVQFASSNEFFVGENPAVGPGGLDVLPLNGVPPFVNTGPMNVDTLTLFGAEAAIAHGSFALQAEGRLAQVDLAGGASESFPGAYATARWVLTGEAIPYVRGSGILGRIVPDQELMWDEDGWGALELATRVSYLDLDGDSLPGPGRQLTSFATGLSWYATRNTRFQVEWIHSELDDQTLGRSDSDTFAFRLQVDF